MFGVLFMITAYVSSWSVVFYANGNADDCTNLKRVYDAARARNVSAGSVGVFDEPKNSETLVHVDLMHCTKKEALAILALAGVPIERIEFSVVKVEWDDGSSRRNRRRRLKP